MKAASTTFNSYLKHHRFLSSVFLVVFLLTGFGRVMKITAQSTVEGLNEWTLYIDQGHALQENGGLFNYSEAEKVLRVGLALRDFFIDLTDIEAVYTARETDFDNISLSARVDEANALGVDFYYSIHSDAGAPQVNSTLMLYGGWRSNGQTVEKTPQGGAAYGALLNVDLTQAMRIPARGNFADRVFYQGAVHHHENQFPYLYVNRVSQMASLLSEAGFHTNPVQQQRNLNAEWKVLEALAAFWSFLSFHEVEKPPIGVALGYITDYETQRTLNGITVTIGDQSYTTDSYESLFYQYSGDPDELSNGFYYIDGLEPGATVSVVFTSDTHMTHTAELQIQSNLQGNVADNLSFLDVALLSTELPVVSEVITQDNLDNIVPGRPFKIRFSRIMNQATVEQSISLNPEAPLGFTWENGFTLALNTENLDFVTTYTLSIDGDMATNELTGQQLDGNQNGEPGGVYELTFVTSPEDITPPQLLSHYPSAEEPSRLLRPVIRLLYDEIIVDESISEQAVILQATGSSQAVPGIVHHSQVGYQSLIHFFPTQDLNPELTYEVLIAGGFSDEFGNSTEAHSFLFGIIEEAILQSTVIDDFNAGIIQWWHPQQANQTDGIITDLTFRASDNEIVNHSLNSAASMKLAYAWDPNFAGTPYIRQYLPPTAPQNSIRFQSHHVLRVWVYGDGSGNELRMVIRDGQNQLETHTWIPINWYGWKLLSWDMANDPVFGWVNGNGVLDGANFYMDGFHLRKGPDAALAGAIYFDHLHFVSREQADFPTTLFEGFENYPDFTTQLFPFITVDVKGDITWNPAGFTFPGSGQAYAFRVMNPSGTTPPVQGDHPAFEGEKYLIAMQSQTIDDDKWLITPQIQITELSNFSFYARSISDAWGLERFQVMIAEDDATVFSFDPQAFTKISEGAYTEAPLAWTPFSYFLGDYAGQVVRLAIRYVSHDAYMFMLDALEVYASNAVIVSVLPVPDKQVDFGTALPEAIAVLNQSTSITDSYGRSHTVALNWSIPGYNPEQPGEYTALGTFSLPEDVDQADPPVPLEVQAVLTLKYPEISSIDPVNDIEVPFNTSYAEAISLLAAYTLIHDVSGATHQVALSWSIEGYQPGLPGSYEALGVFELPDNVEQTRPPTALEVTAMVTVLEEGLTVSGPGWPEGLRLFPNPSKEGFYLESAWEIRSIRVYDMQGRLIISQQPEHTRHFFSLHDAPAGHYLLLLETNQNQNQNHSQNQNTKHNNQQGSYRIMLQWLGQ